MNRDDNPELSRTWLSHRDCASLVSASLTANIPAGFVIVYGVSKQISPIHSLANPMGWVPLDTGAAFKP